MFEFYNRRGEQKSATTDNITPVGSIVLSPNLMSGTAGTQAEAESAPDFYLFCNGVLLATASYPELFAIIGYSYGGSGGSFRLPDLRSVFPGGTGATLGASVNTTGGASTHQHTIGTHTHNLASHNHSLPSDYDLHEHSSYAHSHTTENHRHTGANYTTGSIQGPSDPAGRTVEVANGAGSDAGPRHRHFGFSGFTAYENPSTNTTITYGPTWIANAANTDSATAVTGNELTTLSPLTAANNLPSFLTINFMIRASA